MRNIAEIIASKERDLKKLGILNFMDVVELPHKGNILGTDIWLYDVTVNGDFAFDLTIEEIDESFKFLSLISNKSQYGILRYYTNISILGNPDLFSDFNYIRLPNSNNFIIKFFDIKKQENSFLNLNPLYYNDDSPFGPISMNQQEFDNFFNNLK